MSLVGEAENARSRLGFRPYSEARVRDLWCRTARP
jgi:hypothetical protein